MSEEVEYAGFWMRLGATLIDTALFFAVSVPLLVAIYGWQYFARSDEGYQGVADVLISLVLPLALTILFWIRKRGTPGKLALSLVVVDAETGDTLTPAQSFGRYFGYFLATIPLCLGFLWIVFDARKQGWHDKLAGTVVMRRPRA